MSNTAFDFQDLLQLVELIRSSSQFSEFKLRANGIELELRRGPASDAHALPVVAAGVTVGVAASAPPPPAPPTRPAEHGKARHEVTGADDITVNAPMVGTVYLAPEPGAAPFVRVGQRVEADTQICIVEVMKLMNAIHAGKAGVITQVLVGDAEAVEYGQPLFVISPH